MSSLPVNIHRPFYIIRFNLMSFFCHENNFNQLQNNYFKINKARYRKDFFPGLNYIYVFLEFLIFNDVSNLLKFSSICEGFRDAGHRQIVSYHVITEIIIKVH